MAGQLRADGRLVCVCFSCSNKFQLFMGHAEARLAMQRLGLLLAAVASLSGAAACQTFAGQCVGMISGGEGGQHHVSCGLVRPAWARQAGRLGGAAAGGFLAPRVMTPFLIGLFDNSKTAITVLPDLVS
jgi:hypothetical protein